MATFTFRRLSTNETTEVVAGRFTDAVANYAALRRTQLDTEHKGIKAVNTIRAVEAEDGGYEHIQSGYRFKLSVSWFVE
jgi:hypothetical protein